MATWMSRRFINQLSVFKRCVHEIQSQTMDGIVRDKPEDIANAKPFDDIPGDVAVPFVGSLWTYLPYIGKYNFKEVHETAWKRYEEFGPIVREKLPRENNLVSLYDPRDIEKVFRHEGKYPARPGIDFFIAYRKLRPQWYKSLGIFSDGEEWHEFRSKVQQAMLRTQFIMSYLQKTNEVADDMIKRMSQLKDDKGEISGFLQEIYKWALESIAYITLDKRLGCFCDNLDETSDAVKLINSSNELFESMGDLVFSPLELWKYFPTKDWKKYEKAHDESAIIALKYVEESMRNLQNGKKDENEINFIETLLSSKGADIRDAVSILLDTLLAGIDTTSHTVAFALYFLATNPQSQGKAYKEASSLLSKGQPLISANINDLRYIKACIKESMRLVPITTRGPIRIIDQDMVLSGYKIPAGTFIVCQNSVIGQQEKHFPQAEAFIPERWLQDKHHHPFAFLPFGFGRRMCIGKRIAEQEILLLITKIILNFHIEYHHEPIGYFTRLIHVPDKPLRFQFINR